jgi:glycosyltransferase involved in cell wall biosynthesis
MKIVLVGPVYPYRGGIAHHTHFLDSALQALNQQTWIVSFKRQYPAWLYPGKSDQDPSSKAKPANAWYLLDPLYPWTWLQAAQKIVETRPDLVVVQWWTTFWSFPFAFIARYLKRQNIPVVYIIHNVIPHEARLWDRWLARLALEPAKAFVAQTEAEKQKLHSLLPQAKIEVCPIPIYALPASDLPDQASARKQLGLPEREACLLFFGLVRPYKGLRYLLEALSILRENVLKPHLMIAGEFWEDKNLYLRQIKTFQLSDQIHIFDRYIPDEEVALYFIAADFLVAPYIQGTTQSAIASIARGFGLPMIITQEVQRGLSQSDPLVSQVVPAEDAKSLAAAIRAALSEEKARPTNPPGAFLPSAEEEWKRFAQVLLTFIPGQESDGI